MLHSGIIGGAGVANSSNAAVLPGGVPSAKPYAVMEFEGLLATALSNQSLETLRDFQGGSHHNQPLHRSTPPALPPAPPAETLANWKRIRALGRGRVPTEIRTSPHHIPKSSSDGGLMRRSYLDVTQPHFSNESSPDLQAFQRPRQLQIQDRLHQNNHSQESDSSIVHLHGLTSSYIRSPSSTNVTASSPWSNVAVSSLINARSTQHAPPSNFQPDILLRPNHKMLHKFNPKHHTAISPRIQGQSVPELLRQDPNRSFENQSSRPDVLHIPNTLNARNGHVMSHTPLGNIHDGAFPKSFLSAADDPASSSASLSINTTGSSSSPGSLFSSPPSHHNFNGNKNTSGNLSFFAHSPFADTGSGNTSATLSDGPIPIVSLLQKPGPNLIKPIACKPGHNGSPTRSRTPSGSTPLRGSSESDIKSSGPQFPRSHPLQPPLSSRLHTVQHGVGGEPQSPDGADDSSNVSRGPGAFGKLATDSGFHNDARVTSFVAPGQSTRNVFNTSPPQNSQALPSHATALDNANIYKNIAPLGTSANQGQQQQSPGDPNTSYSSFTGEFPNSETVSASQTPPSNTAPVPSVPQQYQGQQQQQQQHQQRVAGETNLLQTPSPSDSGVGEHEAILREKDAEINTLREVMDRNERAIFQVYEERRHVWLNDTRKLQDEYERKLKVQSRKSYKTEQVLSLQVYKLQQEQKSLQEDKIKVTQELDALKQSLEEGQAEMSKFRKQLGQSSPTTKLTTPTGSIDMGVAGSERTDSNVAFTTQSSTGINPPVLAEETQANQSVNSDDSPQSLQREIVLKNKELIQLRNKLACFETDLAKANRELNEKAREIISSNDKVKSLQDELQRVKNPRQMAETGSQTHAAASQVVTMENLQRPSLLGKQERTIDELQEEALNLRAHIEELKAQQEEERKQWLDEKNKVVRYQKQLQLNYVQMQRKNTTLETEVQQLTLELENRDMKLTALNGEESVC